MFPIVQIGSLAIQVPGLVLIAGLWLGLLIAERRSNLHGVPSNLLYNLVFVFLLSSILGARLSYIIQYPSAFSANPLNIFSFNLSLLDFWGGMASGIIGVFIYGSRKRIRFLPVLDALTPAFGTLGIAIGLANLASGNAFGSQTDLPWGIELWGVQRHPTQIYETVLASMILATILLINQKSSLYQPGILFLTFIALSSAARLFLEGFRGDSYLIGDNLRSAQVIAWFILAASLISIKLIKERDKEMSEQG
jgi:phosphatidylglycerol---prolipoprotein diacylglyceryl transferase